MSSPLSSKIRSKRNNKEYFQEDDSTDVSLDISKIQNSKQINSAINEIMKISNTQKEVMVKDIEEQREKTKAFNEFQTKLQNLQKQGQQKEKEFQDTISAYNQQITDCSLKKLVVDSEINQNELLLRKLKEDIKEVKGKEISNQKYYNEQLTYKNETFSKALGNKDKLITDIQNQILRAQAQYEKAKSLRIKSENDIKEREETNIKMKDRIEKATKLIKSKQPDPIKQAQIKQLRQQIDQHEEQLNDKLDMLQEQKNELLNLKEQNTDNDKEILQLQQTKDQLQSDKEDKEYYQNKIEQAQKSLSDLQTQQDQINEKILKKKNKQDMTQNANELASIINMAHKLNNYERTSQMLKDEIREIDNQIHYLIQSTEQLQGYHISNKDKLLYTIGRQRGTQTGGLGYLLKHALIEKKIDDIKETIMDLQQQNQKAKLNLDQHLDQIKSKNFEQISNEQLLKAIKVNDQVKESVTEIKQNLTQQEQQYQQLYIEFEQGQERLRQHYINEIKNKMKIFLQDIQSSKAQYNQQLEEQSNLEMQYQSQKNVIKYKQKIVQNIDFESILLQIKEDGTTLKKKIDLRNNNYEKISNQTKNLDQMNLKSLVNIILSQKTEEQQIEQTKNELIIFEERIRDLQTLLRDEIKQAIKEMYNEFVSKASQRVKQTQQLQRKHQDIIKLIDNKKIDIDKIQTQIDENDEQELQQNYVNINLFNYFLQSVLEQSLNQNEIIEEEASIQLGQLVSQIERIEKQQQLINRDKFNYDTVKELIKNLEIMQTNIEIIDQKLEEGIKSSSDLESKLHQLERRIKNERINECENQQKQVSTTLEALKRALERIKALLNVIEKEQHYLLDEFNDNEKKKENLAFKQEIDKKHKEFKTNILIKDKFKSHMENLDQTFDNMLRESDSVNGNDFLKIKKEYDKMREEIQKLLNQINNNFNEEVTICKEVLEKMIHKYKNKKRIYNQCIEMRFNKENELTELKEKLLNERDQIQAISDQLELFGINEYHENIEVFKKYPQEIEKLKQNLQQQLKQIQDLQEKIADECQDLDQVETKIVKTIKIEDIYKSLEQIEILIQSKQNEQVKLSKLRKSIKEEIEQQFQKERGLHLINCEQKINDAFDILNKLEIKLQEAEKITTTFNQEVQQAIAQKQIINDESVIQAKSEEYIQRKDNINSQYHTMKKQLETLKYKQSVIDNNTISLNEINNIVYETSSIEKQCNNQIKKVIDIIEELQQFKLQWQNKNDQENERTTRISKIQQQIKINQEMVQKMKQQLSKQNESASQFDIIYKVMCSSEDYQQEKQQIEKKMRRIAQVRSDFTKLNEDLQEIQSIEGSFYNLDIENIQNPEKLLSILKETENVGQILKKDVEELVIIDKGFDKRRKKVGDAGIRQLLLKRKSELDLISSDLQSELKKINTLEQNLKQRQLNEADKLSPEKQQEIKQTINKLKSQYNKVQTQCDQVEDQIRNISADINQRDLENIEPLHKLAKDIEMLKSQKVQMKEIHFEVEKIKVKVSSNSTVFGSLDIENRIKNFSQQIVDSKLDLKQTQANLNILNEIAKNYEGYGSDEEDEEFFQVLLVDVQEDFQDIVRVTNNYNDIQLEAQQLQKEFESKKANKQGNLSSEDIDDYNEKIMKLEKKIMKQNKATKEINNNIFQSRDKLSKHDLDNKVKKRKEEIEELQKLINEISNSQENIKQKIFDEIQTLQEDQIYIEYYHQLNNMLEQINEIETNAENMQYEGNNIQKEQERIQDVLQQEDNDRIPLFVDNLDMKKRIRSDLKQVSNLYVTTQDIIKQVNEIFQSKPKEQPQIPAYKPEAGNEIDEMFASILNRLGISIPIQRLGGGYYMFGSKKIYCKIINGKLVVRVGGGYMGIEEFIMQYGQQEADKAILLSGADNERYGSSKSLASNMSAGLLKRANTKNMNEGRKIKRTYSKGINKTDGSPLNVRSKASDDSLQFDTHSFLSGVVQKSNEENKQSQPKEENYKYIKGATNYMTKKQ